jgi:hypothetical protein
MSVANAYIASFCCGAARHLISLQRTMSVAQRAPLTHQRPPANSPTDGQTHTRSHAPPFDPQTPEELATQGEKKP